MESSLLASITFDAGHQLPEHPLCGKVHGHRYRVQVTTSGTAINPRIIPDPTSLLSDLRQVASELEGRFLNDMLPGVNPDPQGVASWFLEQLALRWSIHSVTVWQDPDSAVTVSQEVRRAH